ncbi:aldehyde dehydrogenase family protein [Sphingobium rhizovicinum]|uniref:Aldehyde dehydrogenase family protein n=1 Tax=Sphingobium rhizovicinum TaxID=432308 RepID=A0ABV7N9D4_9SPHN
MSDYKLLIGGQLVEGDGTLEVINPALGEAFVTVPRASAAQADEAIKAAKAAYPGWAETPFAQRQAKLIELADAIAADGDNLARLLVQEQGKPFAEAQGKLRGRKDISGTTPLSSFPTGSYRTMSRPISSSSIGR